MLEAKDLQVRYGAVLAVRSVSLTVPPGQVVALVGANGAGKTSTLSAISGLVPHGGKVTVDGRAVRQPGEAHDAGVRHLPQGRGLFRSLTVAQNLVLGAYGEKRPAREARIESAFDELPQLAQWRDRRVGSLSGGEQALVALGRLIVAQPRYALLDEPALGLAPIAVDRFYAEVGRLREAGVGVLLVEQYAPRTFALADHVVVVDRGRVAFAGPPADAGDPEDLIRSYLRVVN